MRPRRRCARRAGRWRKPAPRLIEQDLLMLHSTIQEGGSMHRLFVSLCLTAGVLAFPAKAQVVPTIRVGWTIPAEEAKYWMMRRPQEFPDLGKAYKIEWSQFQGTSVMSQALIAGALDCATQGVLPIAQG